MFFVKHQLLSPSLSLFPSPSLFLFLSLHISPFVSLCLHISPFLTPFLFHPTFFPFSSSPNPIPLSLSFPSYLYHLYHLYHYYHLYLSIMSIIENLYNLYLLFSLCLLFSLSLLSLSLPLSRPKKLLYLILLPSQIYSLSPSIYLSFSLCLSYPKGFLHFRKFRRHKLPREHIRVCSRQLARKESQ